MSGEPDDLDLWDRLRAERDALIAENAMLREALEACELLVIDNQAMGGSHVGIRERTIIRKALAMPPATRLRER